MASGPATKGRGSLKGKGSAKASKLGKGAGASTARKPKSTGPKPKTVQVKTKPGSQSANKVNKKKKQRVYTDKELGLPALNMTVPAGVTKPSGKKKGKVFVDDKESMMTILALVNAEKEGQIESKMIKARQLEEIREARRRDAEVRQERKGERFEELKKGLKRRGKKVKEVKEPEQPLTGKAKDDAKRLEDQKKSKKRVAFA